MLGADASHAWWPSTVRTLAGFTSTHKTTSCRRAHVTIAWGRDYDDVSPVRGVILGGGKHTLRVNVDVLRVDQDSVADGALVDHMHVDIHAEEGRGGTDEVPHSGSALR